MDNEVIYKEIPYGDGVKHYDTSKLPKHQLGIFTFLMYGLSKVFMHSQEYKIEKVGMEGIKPPYILLSNHMYFCDFYLASIASFPHKLYNIATIDGYYRRPFIMEMIGCMCKRKFTTDPSLVTAARDVLFKKKGVLSMYPEARYTPVGTTAILPDSLGMLIKEMKVPVVVLIHHGNHLHTPFWNYRQPRKVPLLSRMEYILSSEDIEKMSISEIQALVTEKMQYDEYKWQRDNGIRIIEENRAEGLHKILYKCPHCLNEGRLESKGTRLICPDCKREWNLNENGELECVNGETRFSHIPDWFEWERECVREEVRSGSYHFEDEVDVFSLPSCMKFIHVGKARLVHSYEGLILEGEYEGKKYRIKRSVPGMYGVHVEYDYCYVRPEDCIDISTDNDSLYCYPKKQNVITKISFAVEELYKAQREAREARRREIKARKEREAAH